MKRFLFSALIFVIGLSTYAQTPAKAGIIFQQTTVDFGEVYEWENQPAQFTFTNTSSVPVTVLPIFSQVDLEVFYPSRTIQPGESYTLQAIYYTPGKGPFNRKFPVFFSSAPEPQELVISGIIKSLSPNAYVQCPSLKPQQGKQKTDLFGQVTDSVSGKPLAETPVLISSISDKTQIKLVTDKNGNFGTKLYTGQYRISVAQPEYLPHDCLIFAGPQTGMQKIMLTPVTKPLIAQEPISPKVETPEVIQQDEKTATPPPAVNEIPDDFAQTAPPSEAFESFAYDEKPAESKKEASEEDFYYNKVELIEETLAIDEVPAEKKNTEADSLNRYIAQLLAEKETALKMLEQAEAEKKALLEKQEIEKTEPKTAQIETPVTETELSRAQYNANNILFLIDISSSMAKNNKMDLLKESMKQLAGLLRDIDRVAVIAYNQRTHSILESITGNNKEMIINAIDSLTPYGLTYGVNGIHNAYEILEHYYISGGNNQIILATDGLFSTVNQTMTERELHKLVKDKALKQGIKLSVVGFGNDPEGDLTMSKLAESGAGKFIKIQNSIQAETVLIDEIKLNSQIKQ
jgi:Mg-chelatase subunit ChlD